MTENGMSESVYLTRERLVEIENELRDLKTNGRKAVAGKIAEARGLALESRRGPLGYYQLHVLTALRR